MAKADKKTNMRAEKETKKVQKQPSSVNLVGYALGRFIQSKRKQAGIKGGALATSLEIAPVTYRQFEAGRSTLGPERLAQIQDQLAAETPIQWPRLASLSLFARILEAKRKSGGLEGQIAVLRELLSVEPDAEELVDALMAMARKSESDAAVHQRLLDATSEYLTVESVRRTSPTTSPTANQQQFLGRFESLVANTNSILLEQHLRALTDLSFLPDEIEQRALDRWEAVNAIRFKRVYGLVLHDPDLSTWESFNWHFLQRDCDAKCWVLLCPETSSSVVEKLLRRKAGVRDSEPVPRVSVSCLNTDQQRITSQRLQELKLQSRDVAYWIYEVAYSTSAGGNLAVALCYDPSSRNVATICKTGQSFDLLMLASKLVEV